MKHWKVEIIVEDNPPEFKDKRLVAHGSYHLDAKEIEEEIMRKIDLSSGIKITKVSVKQL